VFAFSVRPGCQHALMDRGLLEGYLAEGLSLERIGELVGRDRSTVGYWLRRYGLRAVNRDKHAAKGAIDREALTKLVEEGRSRREIADEVNRSLGTVRHWLRRYGFATRQTERRRELARGGARGGAEMRPALLQLPCRGRDGSRRLVLKFKNPASCLGSS
jgi:transposase